MVVQVLVTAGHRKNRLPDHRIQPVANQGSITLIGQGAGQALRQLVALIDFP